MYRNILAIPILKEYIFMCSPKVVSETALWTILEVKFNIMQATFVFLGLYSRLGIESGANSSKLFEALRNKYCMGSNQQVITLNA